MARSHAMLAMMLVTAACGGETLDVGRGPNGDPANDGGAPPGPTNSTVIVSPERAIRDLALYDGHLYWIAFGGGDSSLERCLPDDCANTREVLGLRVNGFSFAAGNVYMTVVDSSSTADAAPLLSCPVNDCGSPKKVAALVKPNSVLVDDSGIYWSTHFDTAIYACPRAGCEVPERTVVDGFFSFGPLASDEKHLYYLVETATRGQYNLESVLKAGSTPPLVVASGLKNPTGLRIRDGFVYWSALREGDVARCPVSGCANGQPEILASKQRYPMSVELEGDTLFWLNENAGMVAGSKTPATIHSCKIANCANDVAIIDHALGPASWLNTGSIATSQILVADADAVYYVGDQTGRDFDGGTPRYLDYGIRRLPRKP